MNNAAHKQSKVPPGIIATLTAGFEFTTAHLWLVVLPCLLDLFYWLGPRLSVDRLAERNLTILLEEPATEEAAAQLLELASHVNLFTTLSVPLIGVPALMGGAVPEKTPLPVQAYQVDGMLLWLLILAGLTLLGLLLSAVYLNLIGLVMRPVEDRPVGPVAFAIEVFKSAVRLVGLGLIFLVLLILVWLPLLPIAFLVGLLAGSLFVFVMFAGLALVTTYLSLSVPGIVLNGRPLLRSVLESVRMVHKHVIQTINLLMVIVLIVGGTNLLWHMADDGSWVTLVSIAGHAFIGTALVAAIFVFYKDRWAIITAQPQETTK